MDTVFQQGDVLLVEVVEIPEEAKAVKHDGILAYGEATGHHHRVIVEDMPNTLFYEKDGQLYVKNEKPITITHQEHHKIKLPAGKWEIRKVKEYDHFAEEARNVRD